MIRALKSGCSWQVLVAVGVIVSVVLAYVGYRLNLSRQVSERIEQYRKAGQPVTLQALDEWYSLPADEPNGAPIFLDAFDRVVDLSSKNEKHVPVIGHADWPPAGKPLPTEMEKAIGRYLAKNAEAIKLFRKGAQVEAYRYPIDLTRGANVMLRHLSKIKEGVQLLRLHAYYNAATGNPEEAVKSIEAAWQLGDSLKNEPFMISQLVRISGRAMTCDALEKLLSESTLNQTHLQHLSGILRDLSVEANLKRSLIAERCVGLSIFESPIGRKQLYRSTQDERLRRIKMALRRSTGAHSRDKIFFLDTIDRVLNAYEIPFPERLQKAGSFPERISETKNSSSIPDWMSQIMENLGIPANPRETSISSELLPSLARQFGRQAQILAKGRLAKTALAIERFRLDRGRLPENLERLAPDYLPSIPEDPFSGEPVRYRTNTSGYHLYSVGEDRKDNQRKLTPSGDSPDIIFAVDHAH